MAKSLWVLNWLHLYPLSLICIHSVLFVSTESYLYPLSLILGK